MAQKIIIDADPGIGDALAIVLALLDPELDVIGVTATAGCVSGNAATRNLQALVENLDPPKWPRLGDAEPQPATLVPSSGNGEENMLALHGPTGLGDAEFRVADLHNGRHSAKLLIDIVRAEPHEITLLTLGPLTNVELAVERAPDFLSMLNGLVCLGGSVAVGGDVTAAAEFNVYSNTEAARTILRSPATKTLIPLDATERTVLTFEHYDRLALDETTAAGRLLCQLLPFFFRAHHQYLGLEGIRIAEVVALASIARPNLFRFEPMVLDVETSGELTQGMTVFDRRGTERWQTNIDVATEVDSRGVLDYIERVLRAAQ